jgi:hypothetical protein
VEYIVSLKKELNLMNEKAAKERYLELLAMGYSEKDIVWAEPVPIQVHLDIGQSAVDNTNAMTNDVTNRLDNSSQYSQDIANGDELPSDTFS